MTQQTAAERLEAWNEGDDTWRNGYEPDALDWQRDLRAVLGQREVLLAELITMTERFKRCCLHAGNSEETAELACAWARAVIAQAEGA